MRPSDNAPAWWMHFVAFNRIRDVDFTQTPTHMFDVAKVIPTTINTAGWHIAHIFSAKDRNTDWANWSREELVRRFIRNIHPCNCFYVPKSGWHRCGGDAGVIAFFASVYAQRYSSVWDEFLTFAEAAIPVQCPIPQYVYEPRARMVFGTASATHNSIAACYHDSRLCFKADVIEPLLMADVFEITTPNGIFRMSKAEFYRNFPNVVGSKSYREGRIYHYPKVPAIAVKYRVV